jgi:hypothetical protein
LPSAVALTPLLSRCCFKDGHGTKMGRG